MLYLSDEPNGNSFLPHVGIDVEKHGEPAYPVSAWKEGWEDFNNKLGVPNRAFIYDQP